MPGDTLYFGFSSAEPPLEEVVVYERLETDLLGVPFVFDVIGASHHVRCPAYGFHEVASCERLPGGRVHEYPLDPGVADSLSFEGEGVACETDVWTEPGSELPDPDRVDLEYVFSPAAETAIVVGDRGYETYHTYPEFDLTVRSETALQPD